MSATLVAIIQVGLVALLWMPLVVTTETFHPLMVGKALYARALIEIIAAVWVVLILLRPAYRPRRSWVLLALFAYATVAMLSAAFGVSFTKSIWSDYERMTGVWDLAHWSMLALVAASVVRSRRAWQRLFNWNLAVTLVLSVLAIGQGYGVALLPLAPLKGRVSATLGNAGTLAAILMITVPVAVGLLISSFLPSAKKDEEHTPVGTGPAAACGKAGHPQGPRGLVIANGLRVQAVFGWRLFWFTAAVLGMWVLFATGTRAALIGLICGAIVMPLAVAIWGNRKALRPLALGAIGILLVLAALFALDRSPAPLVSPGYRQNAVSTRLSHTTLDDTSVATRLANVKIGFRAFLDRPLLGWGPENYDVAFNRFAEASIYKHSIDFFDRPHNKVVEELSTKGVMGTVSYLVLWAAAALAVVRRRRTPREEVLAYAILGALAAYFIYTLFWFDTPATMLQWSLLIAWVASQERAPLASGATPPEARDRETGQGRASQPPARPFQQAPSLLWSRAGMILLVLAMLGSSLYFLNYRPYSAALAFGDLFQKRGSMAEQLERAHRSFEAFPPLANLPRLVMFDSLRVQWKGFDAEQRQLALEFIDRESDLSVQTEPQNARILTIVLLVRQAEALASASSGALEELESQLQRLKELAPERLRTHQLLAGQDLLEGDYRGALRIAEEFEASAPEAGKYFSRIKQIAEEHLKAERGG